MMRVEGPRQEHLDALFARSTHGRVIRGGVAGGRALGEVVLASIDSSDLDAVRDSLHIREDAEPFHCLCRGDLAIELHDARGIAGTIGIHHGVSVRLDAWPSDAPLVNGELLLRWLADRGVTEPLDAFQRASRALRESEHAHRAWLAAAPPPLLAHLRALEKDGIPAFDESEYTAAKRALDEAYASPEERARALLEWYGSGAGPWSGAPSYESIAARLLSFIDPPRVIAAMASEPRSPALLDGSGRYACKLVQPTKLLPASLVEALLARARERGNRENLERLAAAFSAPEPPKVPSRAKLAGVSEHGTFRAIAAAGAHIVAIDGLKIVRFDRASGEREILHTVNKDTREFGLAVSNEVIVFHDGADIVRLNAPGGATARVTRPRGPTKSWCAHGGHLYWIDDLSKDGERAHGISRAPLGGGEPEVMVPARPGSAWSLAVDDAAMYWAREERVKRFLRGEQKRTSIERFERDGSRAKDIAHALGAPWTLAVDPIAPESPRLWWSDYTAGELCSCAKSGGKVQRIALPGKPLRIAGSERGAYALLEIGAEYTIVHATDEGRIDELTRFPAQARGLAFASGPGYVCFAVEAMLAFVTP